MCTILPVSQPVTSAVFLACYSFTPVITPTLLEFLTAPEPRSEAICLI